MADVEGARDIVVKVDSGIAEMVPTFLANRARDVETLRSALARGDAETVRRTGHDLKGVGGGYGFPRISELGARIERAGREPDSDAAAAVEELASYLARVRVEVE